MKKKLFLFIAPAVQIIAGFLFPFVYWPEMLNWPFILSKGWLPYHDFTIIHTPLLPLSLLIFFKLFGFVPESLNLFSALLLALSNFLICLIVWSLTQKKHLAVLAGLIFVYLSIAFEGNTVWFETLLTPLFLSIYLLQINFYQKQKYNVLLASGILLGIAILVKQTALFILPTQIFFLRKPKEILSIGLPVILLIAVFFIVSIRLGIFWDFYSWGINFPFLLPHLKTASVPPDLVLPSLKQTLLLIIFLFIGVIAILKQPKFITVYLYLWAILSILFIFPRFEYFHLLPFLAFFVILLMLIPKNFKQAAILALVVIILVFPIFKGTYQTGQRFLNPQVTEVSNWLNKNHSKETIFSLNGPDLVYFLTKKEPGVRPWVDQLPWEMIYFGDKFLVEFKRDSPDLVVFRHYLKQPINGLGAYQPKTVVSYVFKNYQEIKRFSSGVIILQKK